MTVYQMTASLVGVMLGLTGIVRGDVTVIRADFEPNQSYVNGGPVDFVGVETKAAAAASVFGSSGTNTWNYLKVNPGDPSGDPATVNPTFSNLLNSNGVATTVGFKISGSVVAATDGAIDSYGSDALENDYFVLNASPSSATDTYAITGLPPNTAVDLFFYAPNFTYSPRDYTITANSGSSVTIPSGVYDDLFLVAHSDANGVIVGTWGNLGYEGDWSGLQIAYTSAPEPASGALVLAGVAAVLCSRRAKAK